MIHPQLAAFAIVLITGGIGLGRINLPTIAQTAPLAIADQSAIAQPPIATNPPKTMADQAFQRGLVQYSQNQHAPAIQSFTQAIAAYRQLQDRNGERLASGNIGLAYVAIQNYPTAIAWQETSLAIAIELNDRSGAAQSLANLANIYHQLKNDLKAIDLIEQSIVLTRKLKQQQGKDYSLEELGQIYAYFRAYPQTIATQTQRLQLVRATHDRAGEAKTLENLGDAYCGMDDYPKAIASYEAALLINRTIPPIAANVDRTLVNLGDVHQQRGDDAKAIAYYQKVSALRGTKYDRHTRIKTLSQLGQVFAKVGSLVEAEMALKAAVAEEDQFRATPALSDANRIISTERQVANYQLLQQVLIRQNRIESALEVAEQGRSRALVELLTLRLEPPTSPKFADLAKAPNLESIRRIAKAQNATLVEYSIVTPALLYIWVIQPTGKITFRSTQLDPQQSMPQLVANSRSAMNVRGGLRIQPVATASRSTTPTLSTEEHLTQLHQMLIAPIGADLPVDPNARVVFLPQGELFLLPFAALRDIQGKYLIERHTIATAPSIQTLDLTHKQAAQARLLGHSVIVGDPTMPQVNGESLPSLPGARQEAIAIGKILNTAPILGDQATKATVLGHMQMASVVHLATHGLLDTFNGDIPGAIALAPSGADNGLLSASEIFDLKLQANLVVLSACDTGRGAINSDGVIGLSRSLIASGVPSVVVSLWAVDDHSTSVFMGAFYRQIQTNPNKAQALRQAMLTTMQQYPNPRDWAAFTLVGESDR
jgi:CHAT domain-containing protein